MEFVEQYLDGKDTEGNYQTKHKPCDFLQNDGSCKLGEEPIVSLTEELVGFIFQYGAPKKVRISNILVKAGLEQICETCGIKLRRVRKLQAIEEFREGMKRFM